MPPIVTPSAPLTVCFLGPFIGRHPGHVTTQAQIVSDMLQPAGYRIVSASTSLNRYVRLLDIALTVVKNRRSANVVCLEVYSGRAFIVADVASLLCKRFRLPLLMILHGGDLPKFAAKSPNWARRVLTRADVVAAPSPYLIQQLAAYGLHIQLLPNVIDLAQYPYRRRETVGPRLFWMRSFHSLYNPAMALQVVAGLRSTRPDTRLIMAGQDKGLQAEMRQLARSLHIEDAVDFPGFLDMAQKTRLADSADICINTSRTDNMPVAMIEAAAMGLPIVTTSVGGIPYLLTDGDTGLLVPDGNAAEMVKAILRLIADPGLAARLSDSGRVLAEKSSWLQIRPQWEQLLSQLASMPDASRRDAA